MSDEVTYRRVPIKWVPEFTDVGRNVEILVVPLPKTYIIPVDWMIFSDHVVSEQEKAVKGGAQS